RFIRFNPCNDDYHAFQAAWTEEFAFVDRAASAVCLLSNEKIASMKQSNLKRHIDTHHALFASKYPAGDSRKRACEELQRRVQTSQQQLRVWTRQGDRNSASFAGALAIVRNGKPFTDGEYAKTFMLDVANELFDDFPNKDKIIKRIKDMPHSARTVHDRSIMMANQVEETQIKDINAGTYCSPALDESTDVSHLSQCSIIARYAAGDTLREESLAVLPMKGTTRGEDLFTSFMEFTKEKKLPMDKLTSVCTDAVPCMLGKNKRFVALLREHEKRDILSFHCILHQEVLCAQTCGQELGEVMLLVIRVLKALLEEVGNHYPGLLSHSNVRWLSRGKVLSCFAACLSEIQTFLEMKGVKHPELDNTDWLLQFHYLVDITGHLNQLNVKKQGIGNTISSLQQAVFAFESKLEVFLRDIETGRLLHFERLQQFRDACLASDSTQHLDLQQLAGFTSNLLYSSHLMESWKVLRNSKLWAREHKWTEMKNLQPEDQLILKTWNELPVTYHTMQRVNIAVLTMFGSTHACEQSFSHMRNIKTNLRSRLTDGSLNACMKLNLTTYEPDYSKTM
uniref:HAT C-terminal dimerisation domain-containing protein n=1 Tax=Esox lucius TaxID=8010 RepID=A0A3P8XHL5_ESOLU